MKIAIFPSWFPDKRDINSGIFIYQQAKDLAEKVETDVIIVKKGWPARTVIKEGPLTIFSRKYPGLPNTNLKRLNKWAGAVTHEFKLNHSIIPYTLIHAHDHLAGYAAMKTSQVFNLPYILTLHNTNFITHSFPDWKTSYIKSIIQNAHTVIAVGKKLFNTLRNEYPSAHVKFIPNYTDTDKFALTRPKELEPFRFVTVTSLHRKKRVDFMIKSFAEFNRSIYAELHIVGSGEDLNKLKRLTKTLGVNHNVHFYGALANEALPPVYHKCHVYLSSSEVETFGISVIEAMSCGLPVLTTISGGPEYLIRPFSGIISSDFNFTDNMKTIYNNYENYSPVSIRKFISEHYSREVVLPKILSLYKEVIS